MSVASTSHIWWRTVFDWKWWGISFKICFINSCIEVFSLSSMIFGLYVNHCLRKKCVSYKSLLYHLFHNASSLLVVIEVGVWHCTFSPSISLYSYFVYVLFLLFNSIFIFRACALYLNFQRCKSFHNNGLQTSHKRVIHYLEIQ